MFNDRMCFCVTQVDHRSLLTSPYDLVYLHMPLVCAQVGSRKRSMRWDQVYGASSMDSVSSSMDSVSSMDSYDGEALLSYYDSEDYVEIPPERALVPSSKNKR